MTILKIGEFLWPYWEITLEFKLEDFWIGLFWKSKYSYKIPHEGGELTRHKSEMWICIIPCFPIHITKLYY